MMDGAGPAGSGGAAVEEEEEEDEDDAAGARGLVHVTSPVEVFQKYQAIYFS